MLFEPLHLVCQGLFFRLLSEPLFFLLLLVGCWVTLVQVGLVNLLLFLTQRVQLQFLVELLGHCAVQLPLPRNVLHSGLGLLIPIIKLVGGHWLLDPACLLVAAMVPLPVFTDAPEGLVSRTLPMLVGLFVLWVLAEVGGERQLLLVVGVLLLAMVVTHLVVGAGDVVFHPAL